MAKSVIVELRAPANFSMQEALDSDVAKLPGFKIDPECGPVPVSPSKETVKNLEIENEKVFLIRGTVEEEKEEELKRLPDVLKVWNDTQIEPF
ncbi:hypothetical protein SAMN02910340_00530 [Methanosarcina thermophila]|jgi:hypothetical protein|uniref:Subtilisin-like serine protease n=3 Tax=Methanosarcina thermophila TaxID=2210 RepID=A0A1I6XRL8_METTE|nr:hypothetical protein [Methanosarcina thermophila]ALK05668.1 MAG: hypothetical protein AAY43_08130 [Methanosarcina sp. 795]AKB12884.1 hypothetical protein MSTHT_1126 [Methanosarcina thermophila TM-1]AKB16495.1 hypothetical protein MSTHC_2177 [Methanosarcina thermophila CHTI-55]NLU56911.1 hypothetical protein [Methanosarcina thermophila]SFT40796.1 hypothetical protein SAMN02910340_00530 [Methanosarcina thermophila]